MTIADPTVYWTGSFCRLECKM